MSEKRQFTMIGKNIYCGAIWSGEQNLTVSDEELNN